MDGSTFPTTKRVLTPTEEFERAKAACYSGKDHLPPHQRAELLSDLMDACDALDAEAA